MRITYYNNEFPNELILIFDDEGFIFITRLEWQNQGGN